MFKKGEFIVSSQIVGGERQTQKGEIVIHFRDGREVIPALLFSVSQEKKILRLFDFKGNNYIRFYEKKRMRKYNFLKKTLH